MSKLGRDLNYRYKAKERSRFWVWKTLRSLLKTQGKRSADAVVWYLAGKENLDMPQARGMGFDPLNLLAIDNDRSVVENLKRKHINAIEGDALELLCENAGAFSPDAIYLDFCGSLSWNVFSDLSFVLMHRPHLVVCLNFLRGREQWSKNYESFYYRYIELEHDLSKQPIESMRGIDTKHRGLVFANLLPERIHEVAEAVGWSVGMSQYDFAKSFCKGANFQFYSYRNNGRNKMDLVAFVTPRIGPFTMNGEKVNRQFAALSAVRTMRKQKTLPRPIYG